MKPGTKVFLADVVNGDVRLVSRTIRRDLNNGAVEFAVKLDGQRYGAAKDCHATRTAALEALAERLRSQAGEKRKAAAALTIEAERLLLQAERAQRMGVEG